MAASDLPVQAHRLGLGRIVAVCWFVGAALALFDIVRRGALGAYSGWAMAVLASVLVAYVFGLRPAVVEELEAISVRNPLRTVRLPWSTVTDVDVTDVLRIHAGELVVRCFAVPFSRPTRPSRISGALTGLSPLPGREVDAADGAVVDGRASLLATRVRELSAQYGAPPAVDLAVRQRWAPDGAGLIGVAVLLVLLALVVR